MMHLAALCTLSGAVQGAWIYFAGNPFRTGRYFLKTIYKIVLFRTGPLRWLSIINIAKDQFNLLLINVKNISNELAVKHNFTVILNIILVLSTVWNLLH